jgi:hypothetical protein
VGFRPAKNQPGNAVVRLFIMTDDVGKSASLKATVSMVLAVGRKGRGTIPRRGLISIIVAWRVSEDRWAARATSASRCLEACNG